MKKLFTEVVLVLDEFLLHQIFERISHWIQMATGFDCFHQERACYIGAAGSILASYIASIQRIDSMWWRIYIAFCAIVICAWLLLTTITGCEIDDLIRDQASRGYRNYRQCNGAIARVSFSLFALLVSVVTKVDWGTGYMIFMVASFYFSSCTPMPPTPQRKPVLQE